MKRHISILFCALLLGGAAIWATVALDQPARPELAAMLPDGALLYLEAKDFGSLLKDWNQSDAMKTWLTSDNHAAFSQSRLSTRLSEAQDEFAAAAGIPTGGSLLTQVAGKQSCLGLYDIGNLEFVYVTRLEQRDIESTPLWQTRGKFEERTEAGVQFYVHQDAQSKRTAAFAAQDGWLILGTREDLVAGAIDRLHGQASGSLSDEAWYATAVKEAGEPGDLRMVLNLEKIVPSPYFRSYWIQRNVSELKQYSSAISDLYRAADSYREERVLVRRELQTESALGDVKGLTTLVPGGTAFYSAQASPDPAQLLQTLRDNLLELKTLEVNTSYSAPLVAQASDAGSAGDLESRIDQAPVVQAQGDAYQPLRALLNAAQPDGVLLVYATHPPEDGVFAPIAAAAVLSSPQSWKQESVEQAITAALLPGLTAGHLGAEWTRRQSAGGDYFALSGAVRLYAAVRDKRLLLSNDGSLMEGILLRDQVPSPPSNADGVTYAAVFQHAQEREKFRSLTTRLDVAGQRGAADGQTTEAGGAAPAFFSGNIASLGRVFSQVAVESIVEKEQAAKVTQTVTYQWSR